MAWTPKTARPDTDGWQPKTALPDGESSKTEAVSSIDASTPTVKSNYSGDASTLQRLGADDPGYEYGDILPFKKNIKTGKASLAQPEMLKSMERGVGDLISTAQNKSTDETPDSLSAMFGMLPTAKPVAKGVTKFAEGIAPKIVDAAKSASKSEFAKDQSSIPVPKDKESEYIANALIKAGHSPEEAVDLLNRAKKFGMTVGESTNNPKLLGMERKISGMNQPGGETIRGFVKERVDPDRNTSVPYKLQDLADPLLAKVKAASEELGTISSTAPKTPIDMSYVRSTLTAEKRPPGSPVSNTLLRIDKLSEWAKSQGDTFDAWHRVKQEIWNLKDDAKNPNAVEKLDANIVKNYYKKVNDVLSRRAPGLPDDLLPFGSKYAVANDTYRQNLAGRTIQDVLKKMPTGGTPASSLKYIYKQLVGSQALSDELFEGLPVDKQRGMMEFLKAVKDASKSSVNDRVKSMEEGTPSFPLSQHGALLKIKDWMIDTITRKDYDALAKGLTSPDIEAIAEKMGYEKPSSGGKAGGSKSGGSKETGPLKSTVRPINTNTLGAPMDKFLEDNSQ